MRCQVSQSTEVANTVDGRQNICHEDDNGPDEVEGRDEDVSQEGQDSSENVTEEEDDEGNNLEQGSDKVEDCTAVSTPLPFKRRNNQG